MQITGNAKHSSLPLPLAKEPAQADASTHSRTSAACSNLQLTQAWDRLTECVLSHDKTTPQAIAAIAELTPDDAKLHAAKGLFALQLGRAELVGIAKAALDAARGGTGRSEPAAQAYEAALSQWLLGNPQGAAQCLDRHLRLYPEDALAVKLGQAIRFMIGDIKGMRISLEAILPAYHEANAFRGYILGCHAFTLEESGDYAMAEQQGMLATLLAPRDAWGRHAVAHVHEMTGRAEAGRRWLMAGREDWRHCNNFAYHMWWHLALFELELGHHSKVLAIYDDMMRAEATDDYRDIANATSLLMRLELDGIDVGERWRELSQIAARRVDDHCVVFADLHYLLALSATHDEGAGKLIASLTEIARHEGETANTARLIGIAMAKGIEAFARGDYARTVSSLEPIRHDWQRLGGSHAQRDIFQQILIEASLRAGSLQLANTLLRERLAARQGRNRFALKRLAAMPMPGGARLGLMAAVASSA